MEFLASIAIEFLGIINQLTGSPIWSRRGNPWIRALASPLFELQWANAEFAVLRLRDSKARRGMGMPTRFAVELRGFPPISPMRQSEY